MRWKTAIREESWDDVLLVHVNDRELLFVLLGCPWFIFLYLDLNFWLTPTLLILEKFIISSGLICKTWVFDFVWEGFYFSLEKQNNFFFFLSSLGFKGKSSKKTKLSWNPVPQHTHTLLLAYCILQYMGYNCHTKVEILLLADSTRVSRARLAKWDCSDACLLKTKVGCDEDSQGHLESPYVHLHTEYAHIREHTHTHQWTNGWTNAAPPLPIKPADRQNVNESEKAAQALSSHAIRTPAPAHSLVSVGHFTIYRMQWRLIVSLSDVP